jgi:hypothetical protein
MTAFGGFIRFEPLTLGEAILIILTVALPIAGLVINRIRKQSFAIRVQLGPQRVEHGHTEWVRVTLKSRTPIALERLNVRFVDKRWLGYSTQAASKTDVEIVDAGGVNWRVPHARTPHTQTA